MVGYTIYGGVYHPIGWGALMGCHGQPSDIMSTCQVCELTAVGDSSENAGGKSKNEKRKTHKRNIKPGAQRRCKAGPKDTKHWDFPQNRKGCGHRWDTGFNAKAKKIRS